MTMSYDGERYHSGIALSNFNGLLSGEKNGTNCNYAASDTYSGNFPPEAPTTFSSSWHEALSLTKHDARSLTKATESPFTVPSLDASKNYGAALQPSSPLLIRTGANDAAKLGSDNINIKLKSPKSKRRSEGRKGDPRMHCSVALRLSNPRMPLVDALIGGGFVFPTLGEPKLTDRTTRDMDGVLLYQRKNQLNRRLRLAKQKNGEGTAPASTSVRTAASLAAAAGMNTQRMTFPSSSPPSNGERATSPVDASSESGQEEEEEEPCALPHLQNEKETDLRQQQRDAVDDFLAFLDDNLLD
eukprot:CAMPEP_0113563384 /NCGR_PEP_ID=MMETSP0015_2-20120614/21045_1 /TAXON_ID=2838 /ORGANISM="Odontella" /LENGTH=299 /DNA_ID=CAMNT_0000465371 /DNA_START=78 /DNA_END=977 /DNA_ORIENTATION=- /assembly_acc=CAM_ASM_000160